jgi:PAX-interacting protein 1
LRQKGYHILEAVNILKWKTKEPLPIFMLTFDRTENIQKIYEISNIRGMRVEVTPYRKTGLLPQCKNCQSWGHTKSYCHKESRCVKCAGKHTTESCSKPKEVPPKCYNCGENHPANYRGCAVAKELQALRNKAANPTKSLPPAGKQAPQTRNKHIPIPQEDGVTKTYADAADSAPTHAT